VVPETLRLALTFFLERVGGKTTVQTSNLASVARMIARHWAHCDEQTMRQIVHLTSKVSMPRQCGLTAKNRARLRQFDDRRNLERPAATQASIAFRRAFSRSGSPRAASMIAARVPPDRSRAGFFPSFVSSRPDWPPVRRSHCTGLAGTGRSAACAEA
jgi:hypothetical protein